MLCHGAAEHTPDKLCGDRGHAYINIFESKVYVFVAIRDCCLVYVCVRVFTHIRHLRHQCVILLFFFFFLCGFCAACKWQKGGRDERRRRCALCVCVCVMMMGVATAIYDANNDNMVNRYSKIGFVSLCVVLCIYEIHIRIKKN